MAVVSFFPMMKISCVNALTEKIAYALSTPDRSIEFDLRHVAFIEPIAVTLLAGTILKCAASGKRVTYRRPKSPSANAHLERIGFYRFGATTGSRPAATHHHVELQQINAPDPTCTEAVVTVLNGAITLSKGLRDSIQFSLNELMTNAFDHSGSSVGALINAQGYTERGTIDICLTDFGRGIHASLQPMYPTLTNSAEAIVHAVKSGITSRTGRYAGLGLTFIQQFLELNEGKMSIISGDAAVRWDWNSTTNSGVIVSQKHLSSRFEGTVVHILARADGEALYKLSTENDEDIF